MAGRLNDTEVAQEMNKMVLNPNKVAFIKQEALEKARELKIKADEEFNIEKGKLVRADTLLIESIYQKKLKQAQVQRKITASHLINKNRLAILATRQVVLNELFADAQSRLSGLTDNDSKYQALLENLLLQGFFQLMESKVCIRARSKDTGLVEQALKLASVRFTAISGKSIECVIDTANPLAIQDLGGVVMGTLDWNIQCSNTLESRLLLLQDQMLPEIRVLLFGPSKNRRFFN